MATPKDPTARRAERFRIVDRAILGVVDQLRVLGHSVRFLAEAVDARDCDLSGLKQPASPRHAGPTVRPGHLDLGMRAKLLEVGPERLDWDLAGNHVLGLAHGDPMRPMLGIAAVEPGELPDPRPIAGERGN